MDETASFGYWVRRQRKALDLTQEALAQAVGCAAVTIKKIELDERRPSRQIAEALALALKIQPEERERFLASARGISSSLHMELPVRPIGTDGPKEPGGPKESDGLKEPQGRETPHNLPAPVSSFVGRTGDLAALQDLLRQPEVRLVSVLGPGGMGKTRLALQAARDLLPNFQDGIFLVDLSSLLPGTSQGERIQSVANLITQTLEVKAPLGIPLQDALHAYFRKKKMLLVMDGFEHLLDAAILVAGFLAAAGDLKVLVTSREALHLPGEQGFLLGPLEEDSRLQLFSERARAVRKDFTTTSANAAVVAEICRRLDGIPLAIELAAARARLMTVEEIAARLDNAFRLLTGGSQAALPRQQTLKAAIDWSYNLLAPAENLLLQRLSLFAGGWTLEAAEAVCADEPTANGVKIDSLEVLDLLSALVDKSLVVADWIQCETRYRLLETIRQYGRDRLVESGGGPAVKERFLVYFAGLTAQAEPHLRGRDALEWLERLQTELENIRTAMDLAASGRVELGLQIAADLMWFCNHSGMFAEGVEWNRKLLEIELSRRGDAPLTGNLGLQRARTLRTLAYETSYIAPAGNENSVHPIEESLVILRALSPTARLELGISLFVKATYYSNQTAILSDDMAQAYAIFREEKNGFYLSQCFWMLCWKALFDGDLTKATHYLDEALSHARQVEDKDGIGSDIAITGVLALYVGNYPQAESLINEGIDLMRQVNSRWAENIWTYDLLSVMGASGNYTAAIRLAEEIINQERELNYRWRTDGVISRLIWIYWSQGEYEQAAREGRGTFPENPELPWRAIFYLGRVALTLGDLPQAETRMRKVLTLCRGLYNGSDSILVGEVDRGVILQGLASLLAHQGRLEQAARALGAGDWIYRATSPALAPRERSEHDECLAALRAGLDEGAFAACWAAGQALTLDQAILQLAEDLG